MIGAYMRRLSSQNRLRNGQTIGGGPLDITESFLRMFTVTIDSVYPSAQNGSTAWDLRIADLSEQRGVTDLAGMIKKAGDLIKLLPVGRDGKWNLILFFILAPYVFIPEKIFTVK